MAGSLLSSLGVAVLLVILLAGWDGTGAEARAFFGTLFQDAAPPNGTAGGPAQLFQALATAHAPPSLSALSDLFFGGGK